ncbi:hypothetical protein ACTXT7_016859 [Hymenolepis weldensis]
METCRTLYTCIWNNDVADVTAPNLLDGPPNVPNAILGVCHGDHWHIQFFTSTKNAARKLDYIIHSILAQMNRLDALPGMMVKCSITKQLVRNPLNFMKYLVARYNGQYFLDANDSQVLYLFNIFQSYLNERQHLPDSNALGDCSNATTMRRAKLREEEDIRKRGRYARERSLFDMFESMNIKSEQQFLEWLHSDPAQITEMWAKYPNWEKKLQQYITVKFKVKKGIFDEPYNKIPYLDMVIATECSDDQHDPNPDEGAKYLYDIFRGNDINFGQFINEVDNILRQKYPRINALVLRGPTTTGKTLIAKNIVKPYNYGTVSRDGDATAFYLQNLLDHDVALMEEPHISMTTVQNFKELFAGSPMMVQVKNKPPQELQRIPCIITTNQALTDNLIDSEAEPIKRLMPDPLFLGVVPLGIAAFASFVRFCKELHGIGASARQRLGLEELHRDSGNYYIRREKLPFFPDWSYYHGLTEKDWDDSINLFIKEYREKRGINIRGIWDNLAEQEEKEFKIRQSMSYIKEEHEPPVSLGKKIKLAGHAAATAMSLGKMLVGSGGSGNEPNPNSDPGNSSGSNDPSGSSRDLAPDGSTPSSAFRLPREEWLFKGNMFHWTTIRFPIRKIAQIPECDIFKNVHQYGDNDNIFLLDNLTMYPFTCWLSKEDSFDTLDDADLAFGCYKKWRVKRVHYKISQFRTVTTRQMVVAGQNKAVTGEDSNGRILYASDQSGCVQFLPINDNANSGAGVNTADFIRSSIYMGGVKVRAAAVGNPLYWEDVRWMNENSTVVLDYKFEDTYLGRTMWFKKLWNYTWSNDNKAKPWGRHNLWLIPGINTTGDRNRTMIWPGRSGGEEVKFFNFMNKNGPICLCVPRTGEYNQDESRPKFAASCLIEGYMDVEVAMGNWGTLYSKFGLQSQYRNSNDIYLKYSLPPSSSEGGDFLSFKVPHIPHKAINRVRARAAVCAHTHGRPTLANARGPCVCAERKEDPISTGVVVQTACADEEIPMAGVPNGDSRYYTVIIRGHHSMPNAISCIYVAHDDHLHVLIKCSGNIGRKIHRVLKDCGVPLGEWHQRKLTKILVNNPVKIIRYFKYRNIPVIIGNDLRDVWEVAKYMPPLTTDEQCYGIQIRQQTKAAIDNRVANRTNRYKVLHEELRRRSVRDFEDIYTIFTVDEILQFNASIGLQWREIAKQAISCINRQELLEERTRTYLGNLKQKKTRLLCVVRKRHYTRHRLVALYA